MSLLSSELDQWTKTGKSTATLLSMVDYFALPDHLQHHYWTQKLGPRDSENCLVCKSVVNTIIKLFNQGVPVEEIQEATVKTCVLFNIYNEPVCRGMIKLLTVIKIISIIFKKKRVKILYILLDFLKLFF